MEILDKMFSGPLPIIYAFLLFLLLSNPKISSRWWRKLGVLLGIVLVWLITISFVSGENERKYDGQRFDDKRTITAFTQQVSVLIAEGKYQKAKDLLDKFNTKYPTISDRKEVASFMESLTEDSRKKTEPSNQKNTPAPKTVR